MLVVEDATQPQKYSQLVYVEFLEFISRISLQYWSEQNQGSEEHVPIQEKVYKILEMLYAKRGWKKFDREKAKIPKTPQEKRKERRRKDKPVEKPELYDILIDEDL